MVKDAEDDSKQHLEYPQNDGHLHLVRVGVQQLVLSNIPNLTGKSVEIDTLSPFISQTNCYTEPNKHIMCTLSLKKILTH